jgi:PAS domain S-box-containing protein
MNSPLRFSIAIFVVQVLVVSVTGTIAFYFLPNSVDLTVLIAPLIPVALILILISTIVLHHLVGKFSTTEADNNINLPSPETSVVDDHNGRITAHYRAVVDISPDAIYVNQDGLFTYVNKSAMELFGATSAEELIGREVISFLHLDDRSVARNQVRQLVKTGQTMLRELRWQTLDGREVLGESAGSIIQSPDGRSFVGVIRDITEKRKQEELQRQSQRLEAIGQLTGGVAHDFNNLLAVVIWNLEMLREELEGDEEKLETLNRARRASQRGADLVKQLLAFSRRQTLRMMPIDLNKSVRNATRMVASTLGENITIATEFAPDLWKTAADPVQIENILLNVALNARDAMANGGVVHIKTENVTFDKPTTRGNNTIDAGDYASIIIADNGSGMAPEVASRAFEPFFTTKLVGQGTGLGLSTVYGFIRQSKGHVSLSSVVGEGTSVEIYLPRNTEKDAVNSEREDATENLETGRGEQILIVEDSPEVLASVEKIVRGFGYHVHSATSGPEALDYLDDLEPGTIDLMLTDIGLAGGMDGWELSARVRQREPDMKVLYMSGYADEVLSRGDYEDKRKHLLHKPFRRVQISEKLRGRLDGII